MNYQGMLALLTDKTAARRGWWHAGTVLRRNGNELYVHYGAMESEPFELTPKNGSYESDEDATDWRIINTPPVQMVNIEDMSPVERRIAIAKDVLSLLDAGCILGKRDLYVGRSLPKGTAETTSMNEVVEAWLADEYCPVCALGAAMIAGVRRFNRMTAKGLHTTNEISQRDPIATYLQYFFSEKQLHLIEIAFEGHNIFRVPLSDEEYEKVLRFYDNSSGGDDGLLRAVFQNIIDHGGDFVP